MCLFALLAGVFPRIAFAVYWIARPAVVDAAFGTFIVPLLGLIFLPFTTLMYTLLWTSGKGILRLGLVVDRDRLRAGSRPLRIQRLWEPGQDPGDELRRGRIDNRHAITARLPLGALRRGRLGEVARRLTRRPPARRPAAPGPPQPAGPDHPAPVRESVARLEHQDRRGCHLVGHRDDHHRWLRRLLPGDAPRAAHGRVRDVRRHRDHRCARQHPGEPAGLTVGAGRARDRGEARCSVLGRRCGDPRRACGPAGRDRGLASWSRS